MPGDEIGGSERTTRPGRRRRRRRRRIEGCRWWLRPQS